MAINQADRYVSYEGKNNFPTNGKDMKHPIQEAAEAERRLVEKVKPEFDEFIILRFKAWNDPPYNFQWVDQKQTEMDYGAVLTRIIRKYESRF